MRLPPFRRRFLTASFSFSLAASALALTACNEAEPAAAKPDAATEASAADPADATPSGDAAQADATQGDPAAQAAIVGVKETEAWTFAGLEGEVHVVRTEGQVGHVYAKSRKDLSRIMGFVTARDRYFQMELTRRLGLGTLAGLLGDAALSRDQDSRGIGITRVADLILGKLTDEQKLVFDQFAMGINDYIAATVAGKVPEPSEIKLAKGLLGGTAATLMQTWDRRSVAGVVGVIVYNLGYETDDVGRDATVKALPLLFKDAPLASLRLAGATKDLFERLAPIHPFSSADGLGTYVEGKLAAPPPPPPEKGAGKAGAAAKEAAGKAAAAGSWHAATAQLPKDMRDRTAVRFARMHERMGHDKHAGYGSNAWAVRGSAAVGGRALLAGDGHLPLSVPSLFYQLGLDTAVFGGGKTHQMGLVIPGLPFLAVGTNGQVAWSQTQLVGDITDWYRDELKLDAKGLPASTLFAAAAKPVVRIDETYVVANVPALNSKGRSETWPRFETYDGRMISDIEGRGANWSWACQEKPDGADCEKLAAGEAVINLQGDWVVPGDTDKDGKITALTVDYVGFDYADTMGAVDGWGHAKDVHEMREASRRLTAYSQNIVAADSAGNILYTGWQPVPCRGYLPRNADKTWKAGSDPRTLIDGTIYGGFTIPAKDGIVDEAPGKTDPSRCVVPFSAYPQAINPKAGYVVTANNDPGGLSTDNSLSNDAWYIGGPWANGYRADTISTSLQKSIADGKADVAAMAALQGDHRSRLGLDWVPFLVEAVTTAKGLVGKAKTPDEQRLVDLYVANTGTFDEGVARLQAWHAAGAQARSGVETFYEKPAAGDTQHAVATMIFNAWMGSFTQKVFDDEGLPGVWQPWGNDARTRALSLMKDGRGAGNPKQLASWNPATQESAFFDELKTAPIETSREIALQALAEAMKFLASAEEDGGKGGFGTSEMAKWLWGLRHGVHFDSILGSFLTSDPKYAVLAEQFSITPDVLPLMPTFPKGDPRVGLLQFPRSGDPFAVDAAGGIGKTGFGYGSGPVFRMVIALGPTAPGKTETRTDGVNVLPGGQSGLAKTKHFTDQVELWLGNKAWPVRMDVKDVVAGAVGREVYRPQ